MVTAHSCSDTANMQHTLMLFSESRMTTVFLEMARSTADLRVPLVAFSCTVAAVQSTTPVDTLVIQLLYPGICLDNSQA
jgi:hypothetical protein